MNDLRSFKSTKADLLNMQIFFLGQQQPCCLTPGYAEADSLEVHLVCFYVSRFMNVGLCLQYRERVHSGLITTAIMSAL